MAEPTSSVLYAQAMTLFDAGKFVAARDLFQQALILQETQTGKQSAELVPILRELGKVMGELGDLKDALAVLKRALDISQRVHGQDHLETASVLHVYGSWLFESGDYDDGILSVERAYVLRQRLLGMEHADTLDSLRMFALQKAFRGEAAEAERLLLQAQEIAERVFGDHHQITVKVLNGLAVVYNREKSTRPQARTLYERSLAINQALKGKDDPYNVICLSNVANVLTGLGKYGESLTFHQQALDLTEKIYGATHYRMAITLWGLAEAQEQLGEIQTARKSLERALIISYRALGVSHFATLKSLRDLVTVYGNMMSQNRFGRDTMVDSLSITLYQCLQSLDGDDSPLNLFTGRMSKETATTKLREIVDRLDADHNRAAPSSDKLAQVKALVDESRKLFRTGSYDQAEQRLKEAIATQEMALGLSHLDHVPLLKELIEIKQRQGKETAVFPIVQQITDIYVTELGTDHPETLLQMMQLRTYTAQEYGQDAVGSITNQMMQAVEQFAGADSPITKMMKGIGSLANMFGGAKFGEERGEPLSKQREEALKNLPPEREAVLAGIDEIDWHSLDHAYGSGDDVPRMLRLLLVDDKRVRNSVWEQIWTTLIHQGTVYTATVAAIPFMIKMVQSPHLSTEDKRGLLSFLREATGVPDLMDEVDEDAYEDEIVLAAKQAVGEGLPVYLELLNNPEFEDMALDILMTQPEQAAKITPQLIERFNRAKHDSEKWDVLSSLVYVMDESAGSIDFFTTQMNKQSPELAFLVAAAVIRRTRENAPEEAVKRVIEAVANEDAMTVEVGAASGYEFAFYTLTFLKPARAVPALIEALRRVEDYEEALKVGAILLDMAFNDGQMMGKSTATNYAEKHIDYWEPAPKPSISSVKLLNPQQIAALQALANHDVFWEWSHNLLRLYGLPESRAALRTFLAG